MTEGIVTVSRYYNRSSIRLRNYDYSQPGAYFVTICIQDRSKRLFGNVVDGKMALNGTGEIVRNEWHKTFQIRNELKMDEYVVMPNHLHGIIIVRDVPVGATRRVAPTNANGPKPGSIGAIIGQFKSVTAKQINRIRNIQGRPVWQRNYFEHIIRDEKSLYAIRRYIQDNPLNWDSDDENPCGKSPRYVAMLNPQRCKY